MTATGKRGSASKEAEQPSSQAAENRHEIGVDDPAIQLLDRCCSGAVCSTALFVHRFIHLRSSLYCAPRSVRAFLAFDPLLRPRRDGCGVNGVRASCWGALAVKEA